MSADVLNFIDGRWVEATSGERADNRNPATGEVIGTFPLSDARDVDHAVRAAAAAQHAWAATPAPTRGAILFKAWQILNERAEEVARALTAEEGKVLNEARGEVKKAAILMEFMAGEGRRLNGETVPSETPNVFAYTVRQPLGVVGLITPWNFPIAIPVWKTAPALITGNTVVLKPAEQTPLTAKLLVEIYEQAGLPRGVINFVCGLGEGAGAPLVNHPLVKAISFTGSTEVGRAIYAAGARLQKKVQCEMGGKNAIVVLADADLDAAVNAAAQGAFGSTGQRCTATSRAIVADAVYDEFVSRLAKLARDVRPGQGLDETATMGPSIDEKQLETVLRYIEVGKQEGAICEEGGHRVTDAPLDKGLFVAPTVFSNVTPNMRIAREEIFGPVLSVIRVRDLDEAIEVANAVDYGMAGSIFTRDLGAAMRFAERVETGMVHVNAGTIGGEAQLPFGGIKATGTGGREMGSPAIEFYTELKTVYVNYGGTGARKSNIY